MALADLNVSLALVTKNFDKELGKVQRRLNRFSRDLNSIGTNLTQSITLPLVAVGGVAVKTAAEFEQLRTSFGVLLGDVEKGNQLFADLQKFAASTPFQLSDIAGAAKQLLAFSFSAEETKDALSFLGDIAAGTGSNLGDLALIIGQARAIGAAYTQDLRQLANRGIPVFDLLKDRLNLSGKELQKFVSDGKVSFELLQNVLKDTTQEGGLFAGGLAAQSQTISGQFSTLKDNVSLALADLGNAITDAFDLKTAIPRLIESIQSAVKVFSNLDDQTKRNIVRFVAFAASVGPVAFALGKLVAIGGTILQTTRLLVGGFQNVSTAVLGAASAFQKLNLASKATVIGLVIGAVVALVAVIGDLKGRFDQLGASVRAVNNIQQQAAKQAASEAASIGPLIAAIQDENRTREEKEGVLKKLQDISPKYFGSLDLEKSKVEDITAAYEGYKTALLEAAKFQAAQAKLTELATLKIEAQQKQLDAANDRSASAFAAAATGATTSKRVEQIQSEIDAIEKQEKAIASLIETLDFGLIDSGSTQISPVSVSSPDTIASNLQTGIDVDTDGLKAAGEKIKAAFVGPFAFVQESIQKAANTIKLFGNNQTETLTSTEKLQRQWEAQGLALEGLGRSATSYNATLGEVKVGSEAINEVVAPSIERMTKLGETLAGIGQQLGLSFQENGVAFLDFKSLGIDALGGLIDAFGDSIAGVKNFGQEVGKILKSVLAQIIKAVAAAAAFSLIFSIFTGGAGGGLGGTFLGLLKGGIKLPGFAQGGLVPPGFPNDSYPALLSSNEAVIPLDRLNQFGGGGGIGELRISGRDLLLLIQREQSAQNRSRGG